MRGQIELGITKNEVSVGVTDKNAVGADIEVRIYSMDGETLVLSWAEACDIASILPRALRAFMPEGER